MGRGQGQAEQSTALYLESRARPQRRPYGYNARGVNPAAVAGIGYPGAQMSDPANYGLPTLSFTDYAGLTDTAPSSRDSQTFTLSENFGWVRGKHHMHYGGDFRWITQPLLRQHESARHVHVHRFLHGQLRGRRGRERNGLRPGGLSAGLRAVHRAGLLQRARPVPGHSYDLFAMDDFRAKSNLTLNYGLRYEFVSPFHEARQPAGESRRGLQRQAIYRVPQPVAPSAHGTLSRRVSAGAAAGRSLELCAAHRPGLEAQGQQDRRARRVRHQLQPGPVRQHCAEPGRAAAVLH